MASFAGILRGKSRNELAAAGVAAVYRHLPGTSPGRRTRGGHLVQIWNKMGSNNTAQSQALAESQRGDRDHELLELRNQFIE
jgi:hypothetical protein